MTKRLLSILGVASIILGLAGPIVPLAPSSALAAPPSEAPGPGEAAVLVADGVGGHLAAGAAAWYRYYPAGPTSGRMDTVTLILTPALELGAQVSASNFQIFSSAQLTSGLDASVMAPIGTGGYTSRDGDPNTAEYLWQGVLPGSDPYYVRMYNNTTVAIDYWLFPADVVRVEPAIAPTPEGTPIASEVAVPQELQLVQPSMGHLEPGQEVWYVWTQAGYDGQPIAGALTMFFTPGNTLKSDWVGFEVMTAAQREARQRGGTATQNTGAGGIVSRDGDPITGERLWRGQLAAGQPYLVRVFNGPDVPIDYALFQGDIEHPVYGPPAPATPEGTRPAETAQEWKDWHVSLTCVTHCDQK